MWKRKKSSDKLSSEIKHENINNKSSSSEKDLWQLYHKEEMNRNKEKEGKSLWKKILRRKADDLIKHTDTKQISEMDKKKAENLLSVSKEIYKEWTKHGKRLYQYSDIALPSIKEFIALSMKHGMLEVKKQELEDNESKIIEGYKGNVPEDIAKKINQDISRIITDIDKTWESLGKNRLATEPTIDWEKLFEKYRGDGARLDPSSREEDYNSLLRKFSNKDKDLIELQKTAMNIGRYHKLLKETNSNNDRDKYKMHIENYQEYYKNIILSTYDRLTGKALDSSKYNAPWLSDTEDNNSDHDTIDSRIERYTRDFAE